MRENGGGDHSVAEVVDAFEAFAGVRLTPAQVSNFRRTRDLARRRQTLTPTDGRRAPVGAVSVNHGYRVVKVAEGRWERLHERNWVAANGPVPEGHVLLFADGDRANCDADNVVAVPRTLLGVLALGPRWHDRDGLEAAVALARLRQGVAHACRRPRRCGVCGREFVPDGCGAEQDARAATCRECLDRGLLAPKRVTVVEHVCPVCGETFEGSRRRVYCSERCQHRVNNAKQAERRAERRRREGGGR